MPELKSRFLEAVEREHGTAPETSFLIFPKAQDAHPIAVVRWYSPWRRFCLMPLGDVVLDAECLTSLAQFLADLNAEHKAAKDSGK